MTHHWSLSGRSLGSSGPSIVYAPVGLGLRLGLGLGLGVLFLYRLGSGLELWSVLTSGEWFSGNIR